MTEMYQLLGKVFNRLTVISFSHLDKWKQAHWLCKCICGNTKIIAAASLIQNKTRSCGCLRNERIKKSVGTHGLSFTGAYSSWASMMRRCYDKDFFYYKYYGGKGIIVCERWHKVENFFKDMGERPNKLTLDRIDRFGNYEPSNCRWATRKEQAQNRTNIAWNKGKYHTIETKKKMSIAQKKKIFTNEYKQNLSEGAKRMWQRRKQRSVSLEAQ